MLNKSLVLLVVLVCLMVPAVAQGEVTYLGNGQYKAVFNAITDDSTKADFYGSIEYYYDPYASAYEYSRWGGIVYIGRDDNMNPSWNQEKFRGYLEYWPLSPDIPQNAIIDSLFLTITPMTFDSISFNIGSLFLEPSGGWLAEIWDSIGVGYPYASDILHSDNFPKTYRLVGAEDDLQDQLEDPYENWFALGLKSNWEDTDGRLLRVISDSLTVYFRAPLSITVLSPNGGEVLGAGSVDTISWSAVGLNTPQYVNLDLIAGADTYWVTTVYNWDDLNPWNGSYLWVVPEIPSNNCKIKAVVHDNSGLEGSDESDDFFTIATPPTISIIWPNSQGIVLEEGETYGIRYDVPSATGGLTQVEAYLSEDGGNSWGPTPVTQPIYYPGHPTSVDDDTMDWIVSDPPTSSGRLKLKAYDNTGVAGEKVNNYNFTIKMAKPSFADNYVTSYTSLHHSIRDKSQYEDYYQIYRREDSESTWQLIATIDGHTGSGDTIEYEDEGLLPRKLYHYKIKAKKGSAYSEYLYKDNFTVPNCKRRWGGDFSPHNRCHFFVDNGIHLGYLKNKILYNNRGFPIYRQLADSKWSAPHSYMKSQNRGAQFSIRNLADGNTWIVLLVGSSDKIILFKITENESSQFLSPLNTTPGDIKWVSDPIFNQGNVYTAHVVGPVGTIVPSRGVNYDIYYEILNLNPDNGQFTVEAIDKFSTEHIQLYYTEPVLSYNGYRMIVAYSVRYAGGWKMYVKKKSHSDPTWQNKAVINDAHSPSISDNYLGYRKESSLYIRNLNTEEEWSVSTGSLSNPFIYYSNGSVFIAYEKNGDIIYRVFTNNAFTDEYNLSSSPDTNSVYPEVYVKNDTAYVLYLEDYNYEYGDANIWEIKIKTIPLDNITVTDVTPLSDTTLTPYTTYRINWDATTEYPAVSTKISITRDGGSIWEDLASLSGNPEEYDWSVRLPASDNAQLRVEVYDERGNVGIGYSHTFTIEAGIQCPLLYVYTDSGYIFDNSLFPWSEFTPEENLDRYKLSIKPSCENGMLRFMIIENNDITYLNNIKLLAVDYPKGVDVGILQDGQIIAYRETKANFRAIGKQDIDYTDSVKVREQGCWRGGENDWLILYKSLPGTDYIMTRGLPPKRALSLSNNTTLYTRVNPEDAIIFHPDSALKYVSAEPLAGIDYVNLIRRLPVQLIQKHAETYEMPEELLEDDEEYYIIQPGDTLYFSFKELKEKNENSEREYIMLVKGYYTEKEGKKGPVDNKPEIKYKNEIRLVQSIRRIVLEVESDKERSIDIKVYDIAGRNIDFQRFNVKRGIRRIDLGVYPSGVYFITTDKAILKAMMIK
ncbi:hypothetical protein KAW18_11980 [candidate division WOR-3 bacterium]|nr:hypothetical protein [candidate division WOR-3 bacterium]